MPTAPASGGAPWCAFSQLTAEAQGFAAASGPNRVEIYVPLAVGFELSGDPEFLDKAGLVLSHFNQEPTLSKQLEKEGLELLEHRAPLIACVERGVCQ
jgi:hypothetical protein